MTLWPAFAGFQEQTMGSLSPGKLADFVILDRDLEPQAAQRRRRHLARAVHERGAEVLEHVAAVVDE